MAGTGAVAIWNDITPVGRSNFYEWHGREHIAERVNIPGFISGRRYVAIEGAPEYFTLYETESADVVTSDGYAERLNAPTEWTLRSTAEFRNVARSLCVVEYTQGAGWGGLIATWRFEIDDSDLAIFRQRLERIVPLWASMTGVAGVHVLKADRLASQVDNEERKRRGEPNGVPGWILLVEGWDDAPAFAKTCKDITASFFEDDEADGRIDAEYGLYSLQAGLLKRS